MFPVSFTKARIYTFYLLEKCLIHFLVLQPVVKLQNNRGNNKYSYTR